MTHEFPELDQVRLVVDRHTRDRHIAAMQAALAQTSRPRFRRRRLLAVAVALILLLPVLSLAARRAVPGDFLYPVKVAFDPVTDAVGWSAGAESRVDEVEAMVDRRMDPTVIRDHADIAIDRLLSENGAIEERLALVDRLSRATSGLDGMEPIRSRLDNLADQLSPQPLREDPTAVDSAEGPSTTTAPDRHDEPSSSTTVTSRPTDGTGSTRGSDRP